MKVLAFGIHGFLDILDRDPNFSPTELPAQFVARFRALSRRIVWVIHLREKQSASRDDVPSSSHVFYQLGSGHAMSHEEYLRNSFDRHGRDTIQQLLSAKEAESEDSAGLVTAVFGLDRDGNMRTGFTVTKNVSNLFGLQRGFISTRSELDLAICGI
ncbi:hypothetical protein VNI00_007996 [Paramarasmius palmivorus]|uniref:Uncharacterized protein n=1 Tax=Paramarasmius palmivorus TaxID=297713 RepID=A0AAW0CYQ4_9AGAR